MKNDDKKKEQKQTSGQIEPPPAWDDHVTLVTVYPTGVRFIQRPFNRFDRDDLRQAG